MMEYALLLFVFIMCVCHYVLKHQHRDTVHRKGSLKVCLNTTCLLIITENHLLSIRSCTCATPAFRSVVRVRRV